MHQERREASSELTESCGVPPDKKRMGPHGKAQGPGQLAGRVEEKVVVVSEAKLKREIDFSTGDRRTVSLGLNGRELDLRDSLRSGETGGGGGGIYMEK